PAPNAPPPLPQLTAAPLAAAPRIDGRLDPAEWARASAFGGFRGLLSRKLEPADPAVLCGYDSQALYLCVIAPLRPGQEPMTRASTRDGAVHRDDAVEILLSPAPNAPLRQIIVNAANVLFDRLGADIAWNAEWQTATGRCAADQLPPFLRVAESCWVLEAALPFASLQTPAPHPGDTWRVNVCIDGQRQMTLAPVRESYAEQERFAILRFLAPDDPVIRLGGLGSLAIGRVRLAGEILNPSPSPLNAAVSLKAEKAGTIIVERTGFDEISGAKEETAASLAVPANGKAPFSLQRDLESPDLDTVTVAASANTTGRPAVLYANTLGLHILPPFRLAVDNYPTCEYALCHLDCSGLEGSIEGATAAWSLRDKQGRSALSGQTPLRQRVQDQRLELAPLAPGDYELIVAITRGGQRLAAASHPLTRVKNPAWFRNDIGKERIVLPPFTPMQYTGRKVSVWGRDVEWRPDSILPASITSAGAQLLAAPMRLSVTVAGQTHAATLHSFAFGEQAPDRCEMTLAGKAGPFDLKAACWMEYDGLIWFDISLTTRDGNPAAIEACRLETPLSRQHARSYHGVPDRSMTGAVAAKPLAFPFQNYFWLGECERGLGLLFESQRGMALAGDFILLQPAQDRVLWRTSLIEQPQNVTSLQYAFGLQATPVRPLPPGCSAWTLETAFSMSDPVIAEAGRNLDVIVVWPRFTGSGSSKARAVFCDALADKTDILAKEVKAVHSLGATAILYHAPLNFTDGARPEFGVYAAEWMEAPRRRWQGGPTVQSRACPASSYTDWLLYAFRKTVREAGFDGLYFDGACGASCANTSHGCGWRDAKGALQPAWPALASRAFNKRVATMLYLETKDRPAGGPRRHAPFVWAHVSGAVCPPIYSFTSALFCGEWFKGQIKAGKSYRDLLTLDTFRPRYISAPWGIPNCFLAITKESAPDAAETKESECALAFILPQGVPIFARYLHPKVRAPVLKALADFGARDAAYTPAWQTAPGLMLDAKGNPAVLMGTWWKDGRSLVVVSVPNGALLRAAAVYPQTIPELSQPGANAAFELDLPAHSFRMFRME
ncbi:MAG TPA: DUF6067 family protein, partial [Candidatus Brocadiia bacterium]|nr:DUF6067 family protein [Candidatus Brocadiia bacterium]